jgi:energy-coupling factor transporter transmembrane protein EcfT
MKKSGTKMQKTIIGFVPAQSPIYALHPLARFVLYIVTGFLPLFIQTPEISFAFIVIVLGLFVYARVNLRTLKLYLPMMVTVFVFITLTYFFFPIAKEESVIVFKLGKFPCYYKSSMWGFCIYLRIISLVLASIFYFSTNRERDIMVALRSIGLPFAVSYFVSLTLRSAGIFMEDYQIIREAEQARGLNTANLSFGGKVKHFSMYMVPLFTLSIRRCDEISVGLFAKGTEISSKINGVKRADYLRSKMQINGRDYAYIVGFIALFAVLVYLQVTANVFNIVKSPLYNHFLNTITGGR